MPRLSAINDPVLADLARELRFASRASLLRQVERAEELAGLVEPGQHYPRDWVVFRITGFRPQGSDASATTGSSLLESLSAFVEQLCEEVGLATDDLPAGSVGVEGLCARWGVSRKSIERARREGLIARRVVDSGGRRLMFTPAASGAYEARAQPGPTPEGRRIPPDVRARMLRRAARYNRVFGCSANRSAVRLGARFGYSAEAVRQLLKRTDAAPGSQAIFGEKGPPSPRERELAFRALRRGLSAAEVGERLGRDPGSVRRAALRHRVSLLGELDLSGPTSPSFERDDAEEVVFSRPGVRGLLAAPIARDLSALLEACRSTPAPSREPERELAVALHLLRRRAGVRIASLLHGPASAEIVDQAETALRRASRVKASLVRGELGLLIATAERRLDVAPDALSERLLASLMDALFAAVCAAVDRFDPFRGGRLAAPVGLALDRAALGWIRANPVGQSSASRARRMLAPGTGAAGSRHVDAWQAWLEPDPRIEGVLSALGAEDAALIAERYGLAGSWPMTASDLARREGLAAAHVARRERKAVRRALGAARGRMSP